MHGQKNIKLIMSGLCVNEISFVQMIVLYEKVIGMCVDVVCTVDVVASV